MSLLHYVPGGLKAVAQMTGGNIVGALAPTTRTPVAPPPSFPDGLSPPAFKTHLCKKYNTTEGCRFGDKCHFAHGEWELRKPTALSHHEDPRVMGQVHGKFGGGPCMEPIPDPASNAAAASFGASATAKISVDVSLAGAIIDKGWNFLQARRERSLKLP